MRYFKFLTALAILIGVLSCSKISEKVEQKVNQKIDETIDKSLKNVDSAFNKVNLDSLKEALKKVDSVTKNLDKKFKDN